MANKRKGSLRRTLFSTLLITLGIVVCSVSAFIGVDVACRADIDKWMPIYPDAELVSTDNAGFIRIRASGITQQIYYTPDSPVDVRGWYTDYRRELTQGQFNGGNANTALGGSMATTQRQIMEDPDSDGTLISYYSECAYG